MEGGAGGGGLIGDGGEVSHLPHWLENDLENHSNQ